VRVNIDPDNNPATNNTIQLTTIVDANGNWSVTVPDANAFADGMTVPIVVIQSDANGNLIGSASGAGILDPRFSLAAYLGGVVPAVALRADSPAIDSGTNPLGLTTDARGPGFARVTGAGPDMGAFELQPAIFVVSVANEIDNGDYSASDLSLREAIELSNLNPGEDIIRFAPGLTSIPISLTDPGQFNQNINPYTINFFPQIAITDSVRIEGRADRSIIFTTTQFGSIGVPGGGYVTGPMFVIDDGLSNSKIHVSISGVTLPYIIDNHENLTLDNVSFGNVTPYPFVITDSNLTLKNTEIDKTMFFYVTGSGTSNTTLTFDHVTVNAPGVALKVTDASVVLDHLQINAQDFDYGAPGVIGIPPVNGLQASLQDVALTVRDSDYRTTVNYFTIGGNTAGFISRSVEFPGARQFTNQWVGSR
jgi:hypothetical protein